MKLVNDPRPLFDRLAQPALLEEIADFAGRWGLDLTGDVPEQLWRHCIARLALPSGALR